MRMRFIISAAAALVITAAGAPIASAGEANVTKGGQPLVLGAGARFKTEPYRDWNDDSDKFSPIPLVIWENDMFFVRADNMGWKAWQPEGWEFSVLAEVEAVGYDSDDSDFLEGMDDTDPYVGAGGQIIYQPGTPVGVKGRWTYDVLDESNGHLGILELFAEKVYGNWFTTGSMGLRLMSEDYVEHYFGVENNEVDTSIGRTAYDPGKEQGWYFSAGAVRQPPDSRWLIAGWMRYEVLGDDQKDSPIINRDDIFSVGLAFGYSFGNRER